MDRESLQARHAAFHEARDTLAAQFSGKCEQDVRAALQSLLEEHGQELSATELELWTLEIVDADWALKDPVRAAGLMARLAGESSDPGAQTI